ncbi:GPI inositol deacylase [Coemansia javaensis]|uniref:GPI inositol-deacylase n=1 Tax=Coemansia javaensis TaxID=2761396 RepID=A0A9W8HEI9_9FUNG|nr:GPI inositol deacylase [Coemansia javaensis]
MPLSYTNCGAPAAAEQAAGVERITGADGALERVVLHGRGGGSAEVYLYGATVTSWKSRGRERLFLSAQSKLDGSRPIRGGIPVVFPQFGPGALPQHGFARSRRWTLLDAAEHGEGVFARFELKDDDATRGSAWPFRFEVQYTVTLTATTLSTIMRVENTDVDEFSFTALLHTYFLVPDIAGTTVAGLEGTRYADKVSGASAVPEARARVTVAANEDRVYADVPGTVAVASGGGQRVSVRRFNFRDVVLWNPWAAKAAEMADFGDAEYRTMLCVEPGTVVEPITLRPGQTISCGQLLTVEDDDDDGSAALAEAEAAPASLVRSRVLWLLVASVLVAGLAARSYFGAQVDVPGCAMSYSRPRYLEQTEFGRSWTRYSAKYKLFLYREGGFDDARGGGGGVPARIPVLFVPGNAGSHKQVRSIAAAAADAFVELVGRDPAAAAARGQIGYDFFTVSLNEELTALHGYSILEQADFVNDAIHYILSLYPKSRGRAPPGLALPASVVVVGHSMGGVVARTAFTLPNYIPGSIQAIFTLSTPHNNPTASLERHVDEVYDSVNRFWRHGFHNGTLDAVSLVSIAGGNLDSMINSDYSYVGDLAPARNALSVLSSGINDVWLSVDHQSVLWCAQMARKFAATIVQVMDARRPEQLVPLNERMAIMRRALYSSLEDGFATDRPLVPRATAAENYRYVHHHRPAGAARAALRLNPARMHALAAAAPAAKRRKARALHLLPLDKEDADVSGRILQLLYDPLLFTAHHDEADTAQFQPALLGCSRAATAADPDAVACETVPMPSAAKLPRRLSTDDSGAPPRPLHYVEAPLAALGRFDYIGLEVPADPQAEGFLQAAVADRPAQREWAPGYLRLLRPTTLSVPAPGLRTRIRLAVPENPLVVFRATVAVRGRPDAAQTQQAAARFPAIMRQSDARRFETRFWHSLDAADVAIHGRGAYFSADTTTTTTTASAAVAGRRADVWDGVHIDLWVDTDVVAGLEVTLRINWYSSLNRMVKRHDMALLALSFAWACLVLLRQLRSWNGAEEGNNNKPAGAVFPSCLGAIERLVRDGTLALAVAAGLLTPVVQELVAWAMHDVWSPATLVAWNNLFMGVRGSGWPLALAPALLVVVALGFVALQAVVLAAVCALLARAAAYVRGRHAAGPAADDLEKRAARVSVRAPVAALAFVAFVSTLVPYQFAFLVIYLAQLITVVHTMAAAARLVDNNNKEDQEEEGDEEEKEGPRRLAGLANYQLGLLLFWTNGLPYCVPELLVWVRNLSVLWFEDAPADHNLANMAGFFALRLLASYSVIPRLPAAGQSPLCRGVRWKRAVTHAVFALGVAYAWLFGTRRPFVLYSVANAVSAWLAVVHCAHYLPLRWAAGKAPPHPAAAVQPPPKPSSAPSSLDCRPEPLAASTKSPPRPDRTATIKAHLDRKLR